MRFYRQVCENDVYSIRLYFDIRTDVIDWVHGTTNPAKVGLGPIVS